MITKLHLKGLLRFSFGSRLMLRDSTMLKITSRSGWEGPFITKEGRAVLIFCHWRLPADVLSK